MAADRDVEFDLLATDKTSKATRTATKNFSELKKKVDASSKSNDKWSKALTTVTKRVGAMAKGVLKAASTVGALASVVGPAVTGLIGLGKGLAAVGKGAAGLAPLVAFIPSLVGSVALIAGTLKLAAPGLKSAFEPVARQFYDADGNATALTKTIQDLASRGVKPLAQQFVKLHMSTIVANMDQIAMATNGVITRTLAWVNSAEGVALVKTIANATGDTFEKLAPKIDTAVIALLRLAGRAGDRAITGLGDVIGKILDKFTAWANSKSIDDINAALDKLKGGWGKTKETFDHVKQIVDWVVQNQAKIQAFSTAMGVFALIGSIVTGQWWAAIIAGTSLLLGNWAVVTTTFNGVKAWWSGVWNGIKNDPTLQALVDAVKGHFEKLAPIVRDAFNTFKTDVMPRLVELKDTIHNDVIPALTDFINTVSPIAVWLAQTFGPVVGKVFGAFVEIITGAVKIVAGILNIFTATFTGDWSKAWDGVKKVFSGAWDIIKGVFSVAWAFISAAFTGGIAVVLGAVTGWKDKLIGVFKGAGDWLKGVGAAIVDGLAGAISGAWSKVSGAIGSLITKAKNAVPAPLRPFLGFSGGDTSGWAPAQFAAAFAGGGSFGMSGGSRSRSGGPTPVNVDVGVSLDGAPFYAMTARTVTAAEKRSAWRTKVGKR